VLPRLPPYRDCSTPGDPPGDCSTCAPGDGGANAPGDPPGDPNRAKDNAAASGFAAVHARMAFKYSTLYADC